MENIKTLVAQALTLTDHEVEFVTQDDDANPVKGPDGIIGWFNGRTPDCFIDVEPNVVRTVLEVRENITDYLDDTLLSFALNKDRNVEPEVVEDDNEEAEGWYCVASYK